MRGSLFALTILVVAPTLAFSQTEHNPKTAKQATITGCLSKTKGNQYQLVDQKKVTNLLISDTVNLESYVGQSVTLIGNQSATPSTDTGTKRPTPTFRVREVQQASGTCK